MASHSHHYHHRGFPRLGKVAEILPYASVQTMPLRFDWGCITFQTAYYVHVIHIWSVEVFERLLRYRMGIWLPTHINTTTTDLSSDLWELVESLPDASLQAMPLCFDWGFRTFQTASYVHVIHIWSVEVFEHILRIDDMASHSHWYYHRCFIRFVRFGWNPTWCKFASHATTFLLRL